MGSLLVNEAPGVLCSFWADLLALSFSTASPSSPSVSLGHVALHFSGPSSFSASQLLCSSLSGAHIGPFFAASIAQLLGEQSLIEAPFLGGKVRVYCLSVIEPATPP